MRKRHRLHVVSHFTPPLVVHLPPPVSHCDTIGKFKITLLLLRSRSFSGKQRRLLEIVLHRRRSLGSRRLSLMAGGRTPPRPSLAAPNTGSPSRTPSLPPPGVAKKTSRWLPPPRSADAGFPPSRAFAFCLLPSALYALDRGEGTVTTKSNFFDTGASTERPRIASPPPCARVRWPPTR